MASAGNPIANSSAFSVLIAPMPPNPISVIKKVTTPVGWNAARCSSRGQPRRLLPAGFLRAGQRGPRKIVQTEYNQQETDCGPKRCGWYPSQKQDAKRNANGTSNNQRHEPADINTVTQLPDCVTLDKQSICNNQSRRLDRCQRI